MRDELENKLCEEYSFYNTNKSMQESLMCFGFSCDDGWYELIESLSKKVKDLLTKYEVPEGVFEVLQVKEKYGGLRFYYAFAEEVEATLESELFDLVQEYEKKSETTCEKCGSEGKVRGGYWVTCLCDVCFTKDR